MRKSPFSIFGCASIMMRRVQRLTAGLLVFSLFVPLVPLYAQEVSDPALPSADVTVDSPTTSAPDTTSPPTETLITPQTFPSLMDAVAPGASSETSRAINKSSTESLSALTSGSAPAVTTAYPSQSFSLSEVQHNSGAFRHTYQIIVPPGRNNLQPKLELSYNNQDRQEGSIFGYGWSINIPYIERLNKFGTDKLYSTTTPNYFVSSLDGELATTTTASVYAAKVDNGSFNSYTFSNGYWLMKDKYGVQYKFGYSTGTRQNDPNDSTKVYRWMLEEMRDPNNNYVSYAYTKDSGQIYPSVIKYTGNGSTDGAFEVDFLKELRPDISTSTVSAFSVTTKYRIYEIDNLVDGTWVSKYVLSFGTGGNGSRSLLNSITNTGRDENGNTLSFPATTFNYLRKQTGWAEDGSWLIPVALTNNGFESAYRIADVNGDGLPDIFAGAGGYTEMFINNGHGWTQDTSWIVPVSFMVNGADAGYRIADVNGDTLPDIFKGHGGNSLMFIHNGHGWTEASTTVPVDFVDAYGKPTAFKIADINGDGLSDIFGSYTVPGGMGSTVYINTGHSWTEDSSWSIPVPFSDISNNDTGYKIIDVNGDGLPDIIRSDSAAGGWTSEVYTNNGHGWVEDSSWYIPTAFEDNTGDDLGFKIADVNGDNLPDIFNRYYFNGEIQIMYINNGHGWTDESSSWAIPVRLINNGADPGYRITDLNGDNLSEIFRRDGEASDVYINKGQEDDILAKVTNPQGGSTNIAYKQAALYTNSSGSLANKAPFSLYTVQGLGINDGLGTIGTTTYSYQGGLYYFGGLLDKKFAGFEMVSTTDPVGNITKNFYHTGTTTDSTHGEYQDHISKAGKPYRVEKYNNAGNLFEKTINKWDRVDFGGGRNFVKLIQTLTSAYDGDSSHKDKAEKYTYESAYGNLQQKINYGEVTGSDDGTFTDSGTDLASTTITYAASSTAYMAGFPATELTQNQNLSKVSEKRHYYDGLSLGYLGRGNETKSEGWLTSSTYASTTKAYDGTYGLVTSLRDANGNLTSYTLDAKNLYAATSTNALNQATGYTYDYASGKVKNTYDANNRLYSTVYDAFRRPLTVKIPDPSTGSLGTKTAYAYTDSSTPGSTSVQQTDYLSSATSTNTYTYLDGLGRNLQVRKQTEDSNTFAVKDYTYNTLGLIATESLPYFASSSARSAGTTNGALKTFYSYDPLQRVLSMGTAVGTTTTSYDDWTTHVTDANGEVKDYTKDAYGNLVTVVEHNGGNAYTTSYEYDRNNNLTKITDALSNIRNFTYDGLGRRLTAEDLHASGDGTYGSWTYTFDPAGNMTQQVDPKSQTVNFTYDVLNRPLTENYTGLAGTEVTYAYDSCTDGAGRLCTATTPDVVTALTYRPNGLVASETRTINSTPFVTTYSYDRQNNQTNVVYPDNSEVSYAYNAGGLPETIAYKPSGGSFADMVSDLDYSPLGKLTYKLFGNGVESAYTYDANHLYRLTRILTTASSTQMSGGMGFGGGFGETLARMTTKLPLAIQTILLDGEGAPKDVFAEDTVPTTTSIIEEPVMVVPPPVIENNSTATPANVFEIVTPGLIPDSSAMGTPTSEASSTIPAGIFGGNPVIIQEMLGDVSSSSTVPVSPAISKDVPENVPVKAGKKPVDSGTGGDIRGWNYKTKVENNRGISEFHQKWIHYLSDNGNWLDIDTTISLSADGSGFEMKEAPFEAYFPLRSTGVAVMHNNNRYDVHTNSEITSKALDMTITAEDVKDVPGRIVQGDLLVATGLQTNVNYVLYEGAYPEGDLIYYIDFGKAPRLEKLVRINSLPTKYKYGFTIAYDSPVKFRSISKQELAEELSTKTRSVAYTVSPEIAKGKPLSVKSDLSDARGIGFKTFKIWDSDSSYRSNVEIPRNIKDVDTTITAKSNGAYYLEKDVTSFFASPVTYPVYTDTIATFYPDANAETSSVDGETIRDTSTSWADARSGAGTTFNSGDTSIIAAVQSEPVSAGRWIITRDVFLYDTSSLDDSMIVGSSTHMIHRASLIYGYRDDESTYPANLSLVSSNPASPTGLVTSDYNIGNWGSTRLSDTDIPIASFIVNDSYYYHVLNATGRSAISATSTTRLGIRASSDLDNNEPTARSYSQVYTADETGTSNDPVLLVEYTLGNVAPTAPTSLLTEGQTNPVNINDATPEFSAIYNDPDTGDVAVSYQIQVATSTDFTANIWDSTKTTLASSTQQGSRISDISYAGSALATSTTYYWRIKFWDTADAGGAWNTTTSSFSYSGSSGVGTTTPSIINATHFDVGSVGTSYSTSYDSGSTGSNRMLVVMFGSAAGTVPTLSATYNSVSMTCVPMSGIPMNPTAAWTTGYCYLANPAMGSNTLALSYNNQRPWIFVATLQNVSSVDDDAFGDSYPYTGTHASASITTAEGNEFILAQIIAGMDVTGSITPDGSQAAVDLFYSSVNTATNFLTSLAASSGSNSFGATWTGNQYWAINGVAFKGVFLNAAPSEPTSLLTEGEQNPTNVTDSTPEFSAIYNDPNNTDSTAKFNLQVATSSSFANIYWDSGTTTMATTTVGSRSPDISYAGSTLASSTPYYWRIKFIDLAGAIGAWSTSTLFSLAEPSDMSATTSARFQDISYIYDAVGNIVQLSDLSETSAYKVITFGYDDLHRLTSASTTVATSTPFTQTYTYNAIGNLTNKSDVGSYTYAGTGYANPHAPTSINGVTHTYDNNGNVTTASPWTYGWDYRNRMSSSGNGTATTTYAYDHTEQRVKKVSAGETTLYANKYFDTTGATTTRHIFTPQGEMIATIETISAGGGGSSGDTGFKTTGTVESVGNWTNFTTTRLNTSDNTRAACNNVSECDGTAEVGKVSDMNFGIPSGATINGIEVAIEGRCSGTACSSAGDMFETALSWDNGTSWTTTKQTSEVSSETTYTLGGSSDTWGRTWDDSEFADGTFMARIGAQCGSGACSSTWNSMQIDQLRFKVYYTTAGGGGTAATTTSYIHTDHLGGTNVVTDENSAVTQVLDYYPYGSERISTGPDSTDRHFIGERYDTETELSYLNARYYEGSRGQFLSQDPVFLGNPKSQNLSDPQSLNSYLYANGNPIVKSDPNGKSWLTGAQGFAEGIAAAAIVGIMIAAAPVTIPAAALTTVAVIGIGSVGYGTYANYQAYTGGSITKDQFDYNAGSLLGGLLLPAKIGEAGSAKSVHPESLKQVNISKSAYPESAAHIESAQAAGYPSILTVDRAGATLRRQQSMKGTAPMSKFDRDEYPPAMFMEGGAGSSKRYIDSSDNRGGGACMGNQCRNVPDGGKVQINVTK